MQNFTIKCYY